jgi:hypothetical protein
MDQAGAWVEWALKTTFIVESLDSATVSMVPSWVVWAALEQAATVKLPA